MPLSISPPVRRFSNVSSPGGFSSTPGSSKGQEDLINAYEAEEERIINLLNRKLERLHEEKISLENALEAESEFHINRLTRELDALRAQQQQQLIGQASSSSLSGAANGNTNGQAAAASLSPADPDVATMLETLQRENEQLRSRLVDTERDFIRISRLNEIYRQELIEHRKRLGISIDNIIGLSSAIDPMSSSRPLHRRNSSASSYGSMSVSPSRSAVHLPGPSGRHPSYPTSSSSSYIPSVAASAAIPIARPLSTVRRPARDIQDTSNTSSSSASALDSPFPIGTEPASTASGITDLTSPFSPASLLRTDAAVFTAPPGAGVQSVSLTGRQGVPLTYPSVPPPSLSSSFAGSPNVPYSPLQERRVAETGSLQRGSRGGSRSHSRHRTRDRAGSTSGYLPATREELSDDGANGVEEDATGLDTMDLGVPGSGSGGLER